MESARDILRNKQRSFDIQEISLLCFLTASMRFVNKN